MGDPLASSVLFSQFVCSHLFHHFQFVSILIPYFSARNALLDSVHVEDLHNLSAPHIRPSSGTIVKPGTRRISLGRLTLTVAKFAIDIFEQPSLTVNRFLSFLR